MAQKRRGPFVPLARLEELVCVIDPNCPLAAFANWTFAEQLKGGVAYDARRVFAAAEQACDRDRSRSAVLSAQTAFKEKARGAEIKVRRVANEEARWCDD
jgi:hypothetical protein